MKIYRFLWLLLLAVSSFAQTHTEDTLEDNQTITGNKTITGTFSFTNHNQTYWAGPGATPTIDQAITSCGVVLACFVEISIGYTGPESTRCLTESVGYTVFQGANNITVIDRRAITANPGTQCIYPVGFGGRLGGAINRVGTSYWASSPTDSATATNGFIWIDGTMPSNSGAMYGQIGLAFGHDSITYGSSQSIIAGSDSEAYANFTSSDIPIPYISGGTAQSGISRANGAVNVVTSAAHTAQKCANISSTAKIQNCYGYDGDRPTLGTGRNYTFHGYGDLFEVNSPLDFLDAPLTIASSGASESSTTVTISTSPTVCTYKTGQRVSVMAVGNNSTAAFPYNGTWTVLAPGCNGGTSFTYTNTASGLATASGGTVQGLHSLISPSSSGSAVTLNPYSDTVGWLFSTNDGTTRLQVNNLGILVAGSASPISAAGAYLGGQTLPWAGLYLGPTTANQTLAILPGAMGGNRTLNAQDPVNVANLGQNFNATNGFYQSKRGTAGCTTSGGAAAFTGACTTVVTFPASFADTNFSVTCMGRSAFTGVPLLQGATATAVNTVTVQTQQATGVNASFATIDCIAVHD
jgi:hypothetical protein